MSFYTDRSEVLFEQVLFWGIFLAICLGVWVAYITWKHRHAGDDKRRLVILDSLPLFSVMAIIGGAYLLANTYIKDFAPVLDTPADKADYIHRLNIPFEGSHLRYVLGKDSLEIDIHFRYWQEMLEANYQKLDELVILEYKETYMAYSKSPNVRMRDIGYMGLALCNFSRVMDKSIEFGIDLYLKSAHEDLDQISDTTLKYLNYFRARMYYHQDKLEKAKEYARREIGVGGDEQHAVNLLYHIFTHTNDTIALQTLAGNDHLWPLLWPHRLGTIQYLHGSVWGFVRSQGYYLAQTVGWLDVLLAGCIALIWLIYIVMVDIYEREKWYVVLLIFLGGGVFSFLAYPAYHFVTYTLQWDVNEGFFKDMAYCIFVIGGIEELLKFIPLLLLLRFTKVVNEPYDYILYTSASALGFAFAENLMYIEADKLYAAHIRALMPAVMHMFCSSIIAYGLLQNKYRYNNRRSPVLIFLFYYLLAAAAHGFYDFWAITNYSYMLSMFTVVFFLGTVAMWLAMKNNALNNSNFYTPGKKVEVGYLRSFLVISLLLLLAVEYLVMGWNYGVGVANYIVFGQSFVAVFFILFLAVYLPDYNIVQGKWNPIRFKVPIIGSFKKLSRGDIKDYTLWHIDIKHYRYNQHKDLDASLPWRGFVEKRLIIKKGFFFYLVKLDAEHPYTGYDQGYVMFRPNRNYTEVIENQKLIAHMYLIPDLEQFEREQKGAAHMGWVVIDRIENPMPEQTKLEQ